MTDLHPAVIGVHRATGDRLRPALSSAANGHTCAVGSASTSKRSKSASDAAVEGACARLRPATICAPVRSRAVVVLPQRLGLDQRRGSPGRRGAARCARRRASAPDEPRLPEPLGRDAERRRLDRAADRLRAAQAASQTSRMPGSMARWPSRSPSQPMRSAARLDASSRPLGVANSPSPAIDSGDARVAAGLHVEQQRRRRARCAPSALRCRAARPRRRRAGQLRHAALARPEAEDVVPCRRVAQAAHEVAAVGDRQHVRRQRDRGAAAAAAGRFA